MSEFFVKQCYGKIWHFCHNTNGICYCVMTSDKITNYEVLAFDGTDDFDVCIDDNDNIHLVYQNNNGEILYAYYNKKEWIFLPVLQSKTKMFYNKGIRLIRVNNWLNILYSVEYKGKKLLTHQFVNAGDIQPSAIDVINGNFYTSCDSRGNIYVLYYSENEKSFGIKKYIWGKKDWSDFVEVNVPDGFSSPCIFADRDDKIHIAGCSNGNVVYICDENKILGKGNDPLIMEKQDIVLMWERDGTVMSSVLYDDSDEFSNPGEFVSGKFSVAKIYNLRYTVYEKNCCADSCYGYVTQDNRAVLYYLKEFFLILRNPPKPIERNLQKEYGKFADKLKEDNVAEQLKKINHRLDEIKAMVEELKK